MHSSSIHDARSIAVLRALQLGDLLCAIPALRALRSAAPRAHVALIGLPWAHELVSRFAGYVDELIEFPGYPGIPEAPFDPARLAAFLPEIQRRRFDVALQLHGSGENSNAFVALIGARRTAGLGLPGASTPLDDTVPYDDRLSEIERLVALVESFGIRVDDRSLEFPLTDADRAEATRLAGADDYVCIHPGARDAGRRWPIERFAAVGDGLAERGLGVVLTGTATEAAITAEVAQRMRGAATDLAGRTNLGGLGALAERARLVVTNDTGMSHVADALGVPSVVIFSGSDPARWAPRDAELHRALGRPCIAAPEHCCLGEGCADRTATWGNVSATQVLDIAAHLLAEDGRRAA